MSKPTFYISAPFDTYSGYGARSRDIIKAIIELDKYDVKLIPQKWGDTTWGFCANMKNGNFYGIMRFKEYLKVLNLIFGCKLLFLTNFILWVNLILDVQQR